MMMDLDQPTAELVGGLMGAQAGASLYQTIAVVMALASRQAIDPLEVATFAEYFAANQVGTAPDIAAQVAVHLNGFAATLRSMAATMPLAAGRA